MDSMTARDERIVWSLTAAHADQIAECELTDDELSRLGNAIPHSSIPSALWTIIHEAILDSSPSDSGGGA